MRVNSIDDGIHQNRYHPDNRASDDNTFQPFECNHDASALIHRNHDDDKSHQCRSHRFIYPLDFAEDDG